MMNYACAGMVLVLTLAAPAVAFARPPVALVSPGYERRLAESRRQLVQPEPVPAPRLRHRSWRHRVIAPGHPAS
jgi:hypothetical protein